MSITDQNMPRIFLKMGEIHISASPIKIITVLGSCVSVCMYNKERLIGGMCHGLLPYCFDPENCDKNYLECFRFVDCSIWHMAEAFKKMGIDRKDITVKIFGGSSVLKNFHHNSDTNLSVGEQNVEAAKKVLREAGLSLASFNVGGAEARKIIFYSHTGKILLKYLTVKS